MNAVGARSETGRADARPRIMPGLEPDLDRARELARSANVIPVRYRFVDDLDYDGIAEELGCSTVAARQRVSTAVRTLRTQRIPA